MSEKTGRRSPRAASRSAMRWATRTGRADERGSRESARRQRGQRLPRQRTGQVNRVGANGVGTFNGGESSPSQPGGRIAELTHRSRPPRSHHPWSRTPARRSAKHDIHRQPPRVCVSVRHPNGTALIRPSSVRPDEARRSTAGALHRSAGSRTAGKRRLANSAR
jgi:hypothetical protein